MSARKKTTRKKAARRGATETGRPSAAAMIHRLEQELPKNLRDYVKGIQRQLTTLESRIYEARRDSRKRWTRLLRETSHELGKLEERGERAWRERTLQARRDAVVLLQRLEKAIAPKSASRKKATSKKVVRAKATRKKSAARKTARSKR